MSARSWPSIYTPLCDCEGWKPSAWSQRVAVRTDICCLIWGWCCTTIRRRKSFTQTMKREAVKLGNPFTKEFTRTHSKAVSRYSSSVNIVSDLIVFSLTPSSCATSVEVLWDPSEKCNCRATSWPSSLHLLYLLSLTSLGKRYQHLPALNPSHNHHPCSYFPTLLSCRLEQGVTSFHLIRWDQARALLLLFPPTTRPFHGPKPLFVLSRLACIQLATGATFGAFERLFQPWRDLVPLSRRQRCSKTHKNKGNTSHITLRGKLVGKIMSCVLPWQRGRQFDWSNLSFFSYVLQM